jgi:zinc/manganese transport system substrate-binding protein
MFTGTICEVDMRVILFVLAVLWSGSALAQPIKVVTSMTILADMVAQVGGEDVEVSTLVGPNSDVHMFEPGPNDVVRLSHADLLVMNGLGLEGWMTRLVQSSGYKGPVIVASRDITPRKIDLDGEKIIDPHAWQDVIRARSYVVSISRALSAVDPVHKANYSERAAAYDKKLSELNRWIKEQIAQVPKEKRRIITSHDAFGYFADAYDVQFQAPRGVNTEAEPKAGELAELITQIRSSGTRALFLENMTERKTADLLVSEANAVIGGTLYVDSLSPPSGPAPSYEALQRYNVPLLCAAMLKNK